MMSATFTARARRIIDIIKHVDGESEQVDLASQECHMKKRRVYNVIHVLQGTGFLAKSGGAEHTAVLLFDRALIKYLPQPFKELVYDKLDEDDENDKVEVLYEA